MYGVTNTPEGQAYYDSIFELYAQWGVDFIKCDDICRYDMPTCRAEIEMLHKAIQKCGRPIVLSLSPGPALIEQAWHYEKYANMWRITDDFWDDFALLKNMFWRCELWQNHVSEGCYPDCDMLPLGKLGQGFGGWLMGFALTAAGYIASEGETVVAQPDSAILTIRLMYSLVPLALMVLLAVTAFLISKLSKRMPEIEAKIAADAEQNA
jgi:hypothetical protein